MLAIALIIIPAIHLIDYTLFCLGNVWGTNLSKVPGKFFPLQIDYGDEDVPTFSDAGSTSKLHPAIQDIIRLIFDVEAMKQCLLEMEVTLTYYYLDTCRDHIV